MPTRRLSAIRCSILARNGRAVMHRVQEIAAIARDFVVDAEIEKIAARTPGHELRERRLACAEPRRTGRSRARKVARHQGRHRDHDRRIADPGDEGA